ncbi:MAG: aldo/keto reductase [Rhodoplanes sp.]|uniref:aldo/keto reductase n=1 Tax=Rhodoplanes sp. TaxID=1968906 RepID=UPI0017F36694|nr:aldo/keto reductase [Rhodoplanes sp.]NVO14398.1 aldo/keto reductase [Rhodoplanes sp.]
MDRRKLAHTDLTVSRLCFGTMTFGKPVDQATADRMVARCLEEGIDFFDTANAYQLGGAETMLGNALRDRRKDVVLATKVQHKMGEGADESGLSKRAILRQVEESLKRLQTDWIDLYYLHQPDPSVPIEESLEAMDTLVRTGKVRFVATSNYAAWQVCEMFWISERNGWRPPAVSQPMYSLVARGIESEYLPMAKRLGVSTFVYNPLAGGLLTGKHDAKSVTAGGRFDPAFWGKSLYADRYWHPRTFEAVESLKAIAAAAGRSLISLAFNWVLHHTAADGLVLGASRLEQLEQNLATCREGPLSAETVAACDAVWEEFRGPVPVYNR